MSAKSLAQKIEDQAMRHIAAKAGFICPARPKTIRYRQYPKPDYIPFRVTLQEGDRTTPPVLKIYFDRPAGDDKLRIQQAAGSMLQVRLSEGRRNPTFLNFRVECR